MLKNAAGKENHMTHKIINAISSRNVPCWGNQKKYIAVHYLGVVGQAHDLASDGCGAHFYIYWDGTIYQRCSLDAVPWAVGTAGYYTQKHLEARNSNTISIEMCCKCDRNVASAEDKRWYFTKETQEACAWPVAKLRHEQGIPSTNVLRHYDIVNKTCLAPYVHNNGYKTIWTWTTFKQRAEEYFSAVQKRELKPGMKVKLTQDIALRDSVSTKPQQAGYVKYTQLSASAKKKCRRLSGNKAKLKKGGVVEIKKAVTAWDGSIWVQIKSGWLPAVVKGKYRVKAVL